MKNNVLETEQISLQNNTITKEKIEQSHQVLNEYLNTAINNDVDSLKLDILHCIQKITESSFLTRWYYKIKLKKLKTKLDNHCSTLDSVLN